MTDKKKLLIATDNFWPRIDGVSSLLNSLLPLLCEHYDVTVIAPDFGTLPQYKKNLTYKIPANFKLIKIPLSKFKVTDFNLAMPQYKRIRAIVKKADIVWVHTMETIATCAIRAAYKQKKPIVYYMHSYEWDLVIAALRTGFLLAYVKKFLQWFILRTYKKFSLVIFPSENILEHYAFLGVQARKEVVYQGIDVKRFSPLNIKPGLKEKLGIEPEDVVIGYHGRLSREKDLKTLARAFLLLRKKIPNVKLLIVGDGIEEIKNSLRKKGVILAGAQTDVVPYLNIMDMYVMTSLTETSCLSVMEAMACQLPIISTRVGFINDYINEGQNGYFFEKSNSYKLYRKMYALIKKRDKLDEIGKAARRTIIESFNWEKQQHEFIRVIDSLIKKKN